MFKYLILFVVIIVVAIVGIFAAGTLMSYLNPAQETIDSINQTKNNITFSPSLFQPYFSQYEDWRDKGLKLAKNCLIEKQDALILTLDFKSFFYNIEIGFFIKNLIKMVCIRISIAKDRYISKTKENKKF